MTVDRLDNQRARKYYREKTQQQQTTYRKNLDNLNKQQSIKNERRSKLNRQKISDIETSSNQRVGQAKVKMDEKIENMRDYYRARDAKLTDDFHNEVLDIKTEYSRRLDELSDRYQRSIQNTVSHDTKVRANLQNSYSNKIELNNTENARRIEDIQESFRRSLNREQQQRLDDTYRIKKETQNEINLIQSGVVRNQQNYRRITNDLRDSYNKNTDTLKRNQEKRNRKNFRDTQNELRNYRRISGAQLSQVSNLSKEELAKQREFYRTQHANDVKMFRSENQEMREKNAQDIDHLRTSYDQNIKSTKQREALKRKDMNERFNSILINNRTKYNKSLGSMTERYQASLEQISETSSTNNIRLQRNYEVKINQMNEANQLQRNSIYNKAKKDIDILEASYKAQLEEVKIAAEAKGEKQTESYRKQVRQLEIERAQNVELLTKRLARKLSMAQTYHQQQLHKQELAFMYERREWQKRIGAEYAKLKKTYGDNLTNQKNRYETRIDHIQENNMALRDRDYNEMEAAKLRLNELANARYQEAQARHLKQLKAVEEARSKDINNLVKEMNDKNSGLKRTMNQKIASLEAESNNRIHTLEENNKREGLNHKRDLKALDENYNNRVKTITEDNKAARDQLRAQQKKQLDILNENQQKQLADRGRKMAELENRYEGNTGMVAKMQAANDSKMRRMKNAHFEENKALQEYYNGQMDDARKNLANEKARLRDDYRIKFARHNEDYNRLRDSSGRLLDKKSAEFEANTTRLKRNNEKKVSDLERRNLRTTEERRRYYEGNIKDLNDQNSNNLKTLKADYNQELKDSTDARDKTYSDNLTELNKDYENRMNKTVDSYEMKMADLRKTKGRKLKQRDTTIKKLQQQHADELELQRINYNEAKRILEDKNRTNLANLRKDSENNNSLNSVGAQNKIDNLEENHDLEVSSLKSKYEKEIRALDRKYKLALKDERDKFSNELKNINRNTDIAEKRRDAQYKNKVDRIEHDYAMRLKQRDVS